MRNNCYCDSFTDIGSVPAGVVSPTFSFALSPIITHHRSCLAGHALAVDVHRLELYCLECQDYVYLDQFDDAVVVSLHLHLHVAVQTVWAVAVYSHCQKLRSFGAGGCAVTPMQPEFQTYKL